MLVEDAEGKLELARKQLSFAKREYRKLLVENESLRVTRKWLESIVKPIKPPQARKIDTGKRGAVKYEGVLVLSDFHYPEVVKLAATGGRNVFDPNTCLDRLWTLTTKVCKITENHRSSMNVGKLWVIFAGDICTGSIHDEIVRSSHIPVLQATSQIASVCSQMLVSLANHYQKIEVVVVPGNHGRLEKNIDYKQMCQNNLDMLFGDMLAVHLKYYRQRKIINVRLADAPEVVCVISGHTFLVGHGHGIRSKNSVFTDTMKQHTIRNFTGALPEQGSFRNIQESVNWAREVLSLGFQYRIMGHWHEYNAIQNGRIIINGSLMGSTEYALSNLSVHSEPVQVFMLVSDEFLPSPVYPIQLSEGIHPHKWSFNSDFWGADFS